MVTLQDFEISVLESFQDLWIALHTKACINLAIPCIFEGTHFYIACLKTYG